MPAPGALARIYFAGWRSTACRRRRRDRAARRQALVRADRDEIAAALDPGAERAHLRVGEADRGENDGGVAGEGLRPTAALTLGHPELVEPLGVQDLGVVPPRTDRRSRSRRGSDPRARRGWPPAPPPPLWRRGRVLLPCRRAVFSRRDRIDTLGNGRRVMCLQVYFLAAVTFTEPLHGLRGLAGHAR